MLVYILMWIEGKTTTIHNLLITSATALQSIISSVTTSSSDLP